MWDELSEDVVYMLFLACSICAGPVFRRIESASGRQWCSTMMGLLTVVSICGWDAWHPLMACFGNLVIFQFVKGRHLSTASMVFTTSYLAAVRLIGVLVRPISPLLNMIQMLITLRLVGVSFEMQQTQKLRTKLRSGSVVDEVELKSLKDELQATGVTPSRLDVLHYCFFHVGLTTGPYFTYRTYSHCIDATFWPYSRVLPFIQRRALLIPLYCVLFLTVDWLWPLESVEYMEMSVWYRIWLMYPIFGQYRARMYIAFILSEIACMSHGLGLFPVETRPTPGAGPRQYEAVNSIVRDADALKRSEYDFECVHNIRELDVELDVTMTDVLKKWNTTVQYWLYFTVYRNVPGSKTSRALWTMLMSAFWHGICPGYYLSLLSCPLYMMAENMWTSRIRSRLDTQGVRVYDVISWFLRVSMFSYLCVAFRLLDARSTLHYWSSIYFIGHLLPLVFYLICRFCLSAPPKLVKH